MAQTTYQRVQHASNQQTALLAIAAAIDDLHTLIATKPNPGEWSSPWPVIHSVEPDVPYTEPVRVVVGHQTISNQQLAEVIRMRLNEEQDPDERRALQAQLTLATDKGRTGPVDDRGQATTQAEDGETTTVDIPRVSVERQVARVQWAAAVELEQYLIPVEDDWTPAEAAGAFAKGGPMWLYLSNRVAVLQLPLTARQWLVNELALDSQVEAHEMGRDILKQDESVSPDVTTQAIDGMAGTH